MKKLWLPLILISLFFLVGSLYAANSLQSDYKFEYATVDTDAPAAGYFTNSVFIANKSQDGQAWFSVRGTGVMTVTLQFFCNGDTAWTDYEAFTTNQRKVIDGGSSTVLWRAIVKDADYTSGEKRFGFDW